MSLWLNAIRRKPAAGILDSQSVKGSETRGPCGYDAGKKINGSKRHNLVDTLGLLLLVMVLPANVQDRDGARRLLAKAFKVYGRLRCLWADGGYAGQLVQWVSRMAEMLHRRDLPGTVNQLVRFGR
jgi:putative transposase